MPDAVLVPFLDSCSITSISCWGKVASVSSFSSGVGATGDDGGLGGDVMGILDDATTEGFGDKSAGMDAGGVALKRVRSVSILGGMM